MSNTTTLQQLLDRQAIYDCLVRYSRGVDRLDAKLLASAYHPDATADYGAFVGSPDELIRWVIPLTEQGQISTQHHLTNHSCELDGDSAHTETYFLFTARNHDKSLWTVGGRYLDRFERRIGVWKIATRYCIVEWAGAIQERPVPFADIRDVHANGTPSRDRNDPSYRRPLNNKRAKHFPVA